MNHFNPKTQAEIQDTMITVQEIVAFETFMQTFGPAPDGGLEFLGKICAAARAGVSAKTDALIANQVIQRLRMECDRLADDIVKAGALLACPRDQVTAVTKIIDQPDPVPVDQTGRRPAWEILIDHIRARYATAASRPGTTTFTVLQDMEERDRVGRARYGTPLTAGNGRDHLVDAYQEGLDLCAYLTVFLDEEGWPPVAEVAAGRVGAVSWDAQRALIHRRMPTDVFRVHELLRETVLNLMAIRETITERGQGTGRDLEPTSP